MMALTTLVLILLGMILTHALHKDDPPQLVLAVLALILTAVIWCKL